MNVSEYNKIVLISTFGQENPNHECKYKYKFDRLSAEAGYPVKCRDPRCSLPCRANWAKKESAILSRYLTHHLPNHTQSYRGYLGMPAASTVEDHRSARQRFLRILRDHAKRTNHTIQIYAVLHVTDLVTAHYDTVLYADRSIGNKPLRRLIRDAWQRSGGQGYSLRPMTRSEEWKGQARYLVKDLTQSFVILPARNGLKITWSSSQFFNLTTKKAIWRECLDVWFGNDKQAVVSN